MKLLDVKEVAAILAISPWTVRAAIRDGKLRPVRIGRLVRLDEQEVEKFVAESKAQTEATHKHEEEKEPCSTK